MASAAQHNTTAIDVPLACLSFRLSIVTPLLNTTQRQHWAKRRKATSNLAGLIRLETQGRRPPEPFEYAVVDVVRYSRGVPDFDNLVGGVKALIDCLQPPGLPFKTRIGDGPYRWTSKFPYGLGIIRHDGPECVKLNVCAVRVATFAEQGTHVTITCLPTSPQQPECRPCSLTQTTS